MREKKVRIGYTRGLGLGRNRNIQKVFSKWNINGSATEIMWREGEGIENDSCFLAWETVNCSTNHCEWKKSWLMSKG